MSFRIVKRHLIKTYKAKMQKEQQSKTKRLNLMEDQVQELNKIMLE